MKKFSIRGIIGQDVKPEDIEKNLNAARGDSIEFSVASPGGLLFPGIEIYNMIKRYSGHVHMHISSIAGSMASYIALAGKDKPTVERNAIYFIHNAQGFAAGDQNIMRKLADTLENLSNILAKEYSLVSGKSLTEVKSLMDAETEFIGEDIVKNGFASAVLGDSGDTTVFARLQLAACMKTIKAHEMPEAELDQIAALIKIPGSLSVDKDTNDFYANVNRLRSHLAMSPISEADRPAVIAVRNLSAEYREYGVVNNMADFQYRIRKLKIHCGWA